MMTTTMMLTKQSTFAALNNDWSAMGQGLITSFLFALLGIFVFGIAFFLIAKCTPFSIRKEIEEDQNTSLGIIIGSVILGLALIIMGALIG